MKENDKNRAVIAEVIARGWREPAYLSLLRQNPKQVLQQAGATIPASMDVVLLENTPTVINAILPPMGDMARYEVRIKKAVQMLSDLPDDMEVRLHRDSAIRAFVVVPEAPAAGGELSDAQLEQVVGGKGSSAPKPPPAHHNPPPPTAVLTGPATVAINMSGMSGGDDVVAVIASAVVSVPCFIV